MKLTAFAAMVCAAAVAAGAFSAPAYAVETGAEFGAVTVLGDSIATGFGLEGYVSGDNLSAAGSFGSMLAVDCSEYHNFAVDGRTSEGLLAALQGDVAAAVSACDHVIVSIGGNDFLQPMLASLSGVEMPSREELEALLSGELSPEDMDKYASGIMAAMLSAASAVDTEKSIANLTLITEKITALNPDCDICLLTIYNPFAGLGEAFGFTALADKKLGKLNDGIKALEGGQVRVIDVYTAFKGKEVTLTNIASGDIHPNSEGHKAIYELLYAKLSSPALPASVPENKPVSEPESTPESAASDGSPDSISAAESASDGSPDSVSVTGSAANAVFTESSQSSEGSDSGTPYIIISVIALVIAAAGAIAFVVLRKKNR